MALAGAGESNSSLDGVEGIVEGVESPMPMAVNPYIPLW